MTAKPTNQRDLTRESPFGYRCHACGRCCREFRIQVNPYEVLRLARHLGVSTTAFARDYLSDGPYLARNEEGACVFLSGRYCGVHADRPLVCRIYPLVRHLSATGQETFTLLPPVAGSESESCGDGCVADYLREQGALDYLAAADRYLELHHKMAWVLQHAAVTADALQAESGQGHPGLTDLLDPDAMVDHYLAATNAKHPSDTETFSALHIESVEVWLDALLKGGKS